MLIVLKLYSEGVLAASKPSFGDPYAHFKFGLSCGFVSA